jgi:hypothetical protein
MIFAIIGDREDHERPSMAGLSIVSSDHRDRRLALNRTTTLEVDPPIARQIKKRPSMAALFNVRHFQRSS